MSPNALTVSFNLHALKYVYKIPLVPKHFLLLNIFPVQIMCSEKRAIYYF